MIYKGMKKIILIFVIVGGVILLASGFIQKEEQSENEGQKEVTVQKSLAVSFAPKNYYGATVRGVNEAVISAQLGGNVSKIYVKAGDSVKRGQLLAVINVPDLRLRFKQAEVGAKITEEQEKEARRKWDNYKPEARKRFKLQSESARLEANAMRAVLSKSEIRAPYDGIISRKNVEVGDTVFPGTHIFEITQNNDYREVIVNVPVEIGKNIKRGDKVVIRTSAGKEFEASVEALSPRADFQTGKTEVKIIFKKNNLLSLGEFAEVEITGESLKNITVVPQNAIVKIYEDNFVFINDNGEAKMKKISVVGYLSGKVAIKGISAGKEVIVSGAHNITDGERIKVVSDENK